MDFGMQGTITFTIQLVGIWPFIFFWHLYLGRFIKLGINPQQIPVAEAMTDAQAS